MTELDIWAWFLAITNLTVSVAAAAHAILYRRDTRAAIGWVGVIWLVPIVGALLYYWLGINRIRRRAQILRTTDPSAPPAEFACDRAALHAALGGDRHLDSLHELVSRVTDWPLLRGNYVRELIGGDEAYAAMVDAIDEASQTVEVASYIFDNDAAGEKLAAAFRRALERGVEVRVLIDDVGSRTSWSGMPRRLARDGVRVARFLPSALPWRFRYANLRNHRKILVVDGRVGFTGGMNIRADNLRESGSGAIQDVHFRLDGPVVSQLREAFAIDWRFTTGEELHPAEPSAPVACDDEVGVLCRGIPGGPDEDLDKLRWALLGALAAARSSVLVVTPYFLPDAPLITAFEVAALRGVEVDIVLPARGNMRLVQWASTALLWQVLEKGCRVWLSPPPFDHSKLMVIDDTWSLIGSSNWDPRSLRLNFEFDVECYDRDLASRLAGIARRKIESAEVLTLADVDGRSLPVRLRDGVARLLSPYL